MRFSSISRLIMGLVLVVSVSLLGCAAVPVIGMLAGPGMMYGAGVLSDADQAELKEYTATNLGVDESLIEISNIEKEDGNFMAGMKGRKNLLQR